MKLYRLIEYDGTDADIERVIERSLIGSVQLGTLRIGGAIVADHMLTFSQRKVLDDARHTPGLWPGQQHKDCL